MRKNSELTAKEQSAINFYCNKGSDSYNNWCASYAKAGYSLCKEWQCLAKRVYDRGMVQDGIKANRERKQKVIEHNYEIAANMLRERLGYIAEQAKNGSIQATQVQLQILKELDDIAGLRQQTIHNKYTPEPPKTEQEIEALNRASIVFKECVTKPGKAG